MKKIEEIEIVSKDTYTHSNSKQHKFTWKETPILLKRKE